MLARIGVRGGEGEGSAISDGNATQDLTRLLSNTPGKQTTESPTHTNQGNR